MILLRTWSTRSPLRVGGTSTNYSDLTTYAAFLDPKGHRIGVRFTEDRAGALRPNPLVWSPLANVVEYVTEDEAKAEDERIARLKAAPLEPAA